MKTRQLFFALMIITAVVLQACGASAEAVATSVAATLQISQLETAAAGGGQTNASSTEASGSTDGDATATPTGTITPTPTSGIPLVSVSQDTNCRRGPRIDYSYVTTITVGQQVEVLKTFPGANYVVVANPNGSGDCWLWLQYANQTDFSAYGLAVATQPATPTPSPTPSPTPVYNWTGTWTIYVNASTYAMSVNQTGNSISATFDAGGGNTISLTGTLSANWQEASGNWTASAGPTGTFAFRMMDNLNQFQGNIDGTGPWCGSRNGAGAPGTCQWP
jgi:hypothetical protein